MKIPLTGTWDFAYKPTIDKTNDYPAIPEQKFFIAKMPLPGCWDDYLELLREQGLWGELKFNPDYKKIDLPMNYDASLPNIVGTGWYKIKLFIPEKWRQKRVMFFAEDIHLEGWLWCNGIPLAYHRTHSTPFEVDLTDHCKYNKENELIVAISNIRDDIWGCDIRGFSGKSGGVFGKIYIKVLDEPAIRSLYVYPDEKLENLFWQISFYENTQTKITFEVLDEGNQILLKGNENAKGKIAQWQTAASKLKVWSDKEPHLYTIKIKAQKGNSVSTFTQRFGLRRLIRRGMGLYLNGNPIYLRGATEHSYFPLTCTPPRDKNFYRANIKKLKAIGFNWLRFHTWVPPKEYLEAADELGMLLQIEPPRGFNEEDWKNILEYARVHPSFVIICCGNEEMLSLQKIEELKNFAATSRKLAPDILFNPQEAMRGVEYLMEQGDPDNKLEPYPHNHKRLDLLKKFSDVFGSFNWGMLSYTTLQGDWQELDKRLIPYERPCLSHEIGIHGTCLDLDLEHRYVGTRIGTDLYAAMRRNLERQGLLHNARLYYRNSSLWMGAHVKYTIELARLCRNLAGYDFLGATDHQWHRTGYPCGIMNEFYEMKPGINENDVIKYNGESVLLLEHKKKFVYACNEFFSADLHISFFGEKAISNPKIIWQLINENKCILAEGETKVNICVKSGSVLKLTRINFKIPQLPLPEKCTLKVTLHSKDYSFDNEWKIWIFPKNPTIPGTIFLDKTLPDAIHQLLHSLKGNKYTQNKHREKIIITSTLNKNILKSLSSGTNVLLLGTAHFPARKVTFQIGRAGRGDENIATVIYDHPIFKNFPNEGWCDWQFYRMIEEGGATIIFNKLNLPFAPIVEFVSFKKILKQSAIFELCIGKGRLLVCSLAIKENDPAATFLLNEMLNYLSGKEYANAPQVTIENLMSQPLDQVYIQETTDIAFDVNLKRKKMAER